MNNSYNSMDLFDYDDFLSTLGISNNSQNNLNLYGSYEGFIKGNLFSDLYDGYKNYAPYHISINSEQEEAMVNLSQLQFAMHELNLYLDVFPDDSEAIKRFIKYKKSYVEMLNDYENKYGSLEVCDLNSNNLPFNWESNKFPWEGVM